MHSKVHFITHAKRIVVKVGSALLAGQNGVNIDVLTNLVDGIVHLHEQGKELILVTSGAVAAGKRKINFSDTDNLSIQYKQALAAIGQSLLMHDYDEAFARHDKTIAQVLLTHADMAHRKRYLNIRNTLFTLFKFGVIPVINENDTVSTEELKFSDNDNLGALVTNMTEADIFVCLTDVDCLYDRNPMVDKSARPIETVQEVTDDILAMASHSKSILGTGGMQSKILAAKMVTAGGGAAFIGPGKEPQILQKLFSGENFGTFFFPSRAKMQSRKHWIAYALKPKGKLILDRGACHAICNRGKSLLPSGILEIQENFGVGDPVQCFDENDQCVATGLSNYNSEELRKIKGQHTDRILEILGHKDCDEVLHRDNLVLTTKAGDEFNPNG